MIEKEGVIYTRVSTVKQATEGSGLDGQKASCLDYAKNNGIKIIKTFSDGGFSGGTTKRPDLIKLISFLKSCSVRCLVAFKISLVSFVGENNS